MAVSQSLTLTQVSQSVENNTSTVRILWTSTQMGESNNYYPRTAKYYVSNNGAAEVEYSVSYTLPKNKTQTILDTTITVPHTALGAGSVTVRTWMNTDISAGTIRQTKSLTLTDIPRASTPTLSSSSVDMGAAVTITTNRASSSFTHDLAYSFAGGAYVNIATGVGASYAWTTPDLASKIPSATSGTLTLRCITKSGSTTIGTKTVTMTLKVPSSVVPTISKVALAEKAEGVAAQFSAFVKDKSTIGVTVTAAGAKGSTIKSYSTTFEGAIHPGASFTTEPPTTAGDLQMVTTVTDSRGRTAKKTTTVTVLDYYVPVTSEFLAYRVTEAGEAKSDGEYLSVAFDYHVAPVNNRNVAWATIDYKRTTATAWSDPLYQGNSLEGSGVIQFDKVFTSDYQFDIRLTVTDWFGETATYIATLPTAKVILDIKANGKGLAIGKTAEIDGFEVDMVPGGPSMLMVGVHDYELGDGYGYIHYNNGLLVQWGAVALTPTAINTVASMRVVFPKAYKTEPLISGTLLANSPQVVSWSMGVGTTDTQALTGLMLYMVRATLHATPFRWVAIGIADLEV